MSEVTKLRQQIEDEITAMHLLTNGPAVSKHAIISHKYRNLGDYQQELTKLVGGEPAAVIVHETYYHIMEGNIDTTTEK